jgi:ATPase family associated with various cellular activities (AAA)
MPDTKRTVVVTGDVTIDWLLLSEAPREHGTLDFIWMWGGDFACRQLASAGAAASHAEILRRTVEAAGLDGVDIVGARVPPEALASPRHPGYAHTFADIAEFPRVIDGHGETAWRIADFKGTDPARSEPPVEPPPAPDAVHTVLVVDHAIGYRDRFRDLPVLLAAGPRDVVWQTGAPLAGSPLADLLLGDHADALTALTSADELRKAGLEVGYSLSWERVTEEIVAAVRAHPLARARRVIVIVGASGAVIIEREGDVVLVFDPRSQEGDWSQRYPGVGAGYGRCLDAAVTLQLTTDGESGLVGAVQRGLGAARAAHIAGFQVGSDREHPGSPFPLGAVAAALRREATEFASVAYHPDRGASILSQISAGASLTEVAASVAVRGVRGLPFGIPVETVGAWSSIDRTEIENLRGIRNILSEYVQQGLRGGHMGVPLPIAVFGPPGAGKTFAVRQMATVLYPGHVARLEYDLSQMRSPDGLRTAFHEIRDVALRGDLALVFWDEFDAPLEGQSLGWLPHFLSPMAEGRFHDGNGFHPLGPAIFVFAGGTASSFEDFVGFRDERVERAAKKPDFISRLRGYVDVTGPNRQGPHDVAAPLRRALILRSLVAGRAPQMLAPSRGAEPRMQIDGGVLRAFLEIGEYIHGARSMEAIVQMSSLAGKPRFERSSLPARQQLGVHVDAEEFLRLVRG